MNMGMDTLKEDLVDWIADTVALWIAEEGYELTKDLIEDAIMQEMDDLTEDMRHRTDDIMSVAKRMIKEYNEE